jgi:hypothetical protein
MNLRKSVKQAFEKLKPTARTGFVGWDDGSMITSERPNYIRVRTWEGQEFEAWNENVAPVLNQRVDLYPDPDYPGLLRAKQPRLAFNQDFPFVSINFHRLNHAWPGPDTVPVEMRQFMPLHPSVSGFNLTVRAGWVKTSTGWHYRDSETIDLTTSKPATGARLTLVTIDDDGDLVVTDGTPAASLFDLVPTAPPDLPAAHTPICAVRLYDGQTAIRDQAANTDLTDLRFTSIGGDAGSADWGNILNIPVAISEIAALTPSEGDLLQFVGGEWVAVSGASGTFTDADSNTITVTNGIITDLGL